MSPGWSVILYTHMLTGALVCARETFWRGASNFISATFGIFRGVPCDSPLARLELAAFDKENPFLAASIAPASQLGA